MLGDVLALICRNQICVSADTFGSHFNGLDDALRVDHERSPICQAFAWPSRITEVVGDGAGLVAHHVVANLGNGLRRVMPGFVVKWVSVHELPSTPIAVHRNDRQGHPARSTQR